MSSLIASHAQHIPAPLTTLTHLIRPKDINLLTYANGCWHLDLDMPYDERLGIGWRKKHHFILLSTNTLNIDNITLTELTKLVHVDTADNEFKRAGVWPQVRAEDNYLIKLLHKVDSQTVHYFQIQPRSKEFFITYLNMIMSHTTQDSWTPIKSMEQLQSKVPFYVVTLHFDGLSFHRSQMQSGQSFYHFSAETKAPPENNCIPACSRAIYHLCQENSDLLKEIPLARNVQFDHIENLQLHLQPCFEALYREVIGDEYEKVPDVESQMTDEEMQKLYDEYIKSNEGKDESDYEDGLETEGDETDEDKPKVPEDSNKLDFTKCLGFEREK